MSTQRERMNRVCEVANDDSVSFREGLILIVLWLRFEHQIIRGRKANQRAQRLGQKLNENLSVYDLRKKLVKL